MGPVVDTKDCDVIANIETMQGKTPALPGGATPQVDALAPAGLGTQFRARKLRAYMLPAASVHTVVRLRVGGDSEGRWIDFVLSASAVAYERRVSLSLAGQEPLQWEALVGAVTVTTYYSED